MEEGGHELDRVRQVSRGIWFERNAFEVTLASAILGRQSVPKLTGTVDHVDAGAAREAHDRLGHFDVLAGVAGERVLRFDIGAGVARGADSFFASATLYWKYLAASPRSLPRGSGPPAGPDGGNRRIPARLHRHAGGLELVDVVERIDPQVAVDGHRERLAHALVAEGRGGAWPGSSRRRRSWTAGPALAGRGRAAACLA